MTGLVSGMSFREVKVLSSVSSEACHALTAIAQEHTNQTVVVVTHAGVLTGFLQFVLGLPFGSGNRFKKHNASFNAFEYLDSRWRLVTWNDISHLGSESS